MATPAIAFNPMMTTTFAGGFSAQSDGLVQGVAMDDPAVRFALAGGRLSTDETLPMWGGIGIFARIPTLNPELGPIVGRATTLTQTAATGLTGFSVFNQAHSFLTAPQSPVPSAPGGAFVPFFPLGSGARIAVAMDPSLIGLEDGSVGQLVSWDFNNQRLQPYVASDSTEEVTSMTWSNTNGGQVAVVMAVPTVLNVGDSFNVSGATNTGTGGNGAVNGNFVINTWTDSTHFTFLLPAAAGVIGTIAGTIVINLGTGALACRILRINAGNSKIVDWNPDLQVAEWNNSGYAALIQI
ncbi:MAG: hypothetical protein WDN25_13370 [Acetobacteraceae bacterium]